MDTRLGAMMMKHTEGRTIYFGLMQLLIIPANRLHPTQTMTRKGAIPEIEAKRP